MKPLLSLLFLSAVLLSCKNNKDSMATAHASHHPDVKTKSETSDSLMFSYERTACFGTCPVYEIKVYKNGYASYNGKVHTPYEGLHYTLLDKTYIDPILGAARNAGFLNFKDKYDANVTDLPSRIIGLNLDGKWKKVIDAGGDGPEDLRSMEGLIENLFSEIKWEKIKP